MVAMLASFFVRARMLRAGIAELPRYIDESQVDALTRATFTPWAVGMLLHAPSLRSIEDALERR